MANSTFSGPVRSENGFLEKDEAGNWVPVSGGGGGGGGGEPLAVLLKIQTFRFDAVPALPIVNFGQDLYEYDGTESSTVTVKPNSVVPGTYSNPVVSIQYETGLITAAAEGVAPSPGPSTAPVVGYASVSTVLNDYSGTVVLDSDGLPSGAMVVGVYVQSNTGINGDDYVDMTFSTNTNDIVSTYLPYYYPSGAQYSFFSNPSEWYSSISPLASGNDGPLVVSWNADDFLTNVPYQFTVQYVVFP